MADPILIGIIDDGVGSRDARESGGKAGLYQQLETDMRLGVSRSRVARGLDRDVEFVHAEGIGLPSGTAFAVERAVEDLVGRGVLLIIGPATGDNAIAVTHLADRYETAMINWSASERARSEWMFHMQVGSHENESILMARHLADKGARRIGVVYDASPIGKRHLDFFEDECRILGIGIGARLSISPIATDAAEVVDELERFDPEGYVYMGLGWAGRELAKALADVDRSAPRVMNAAGMRGADPEYARDIDGWVYPDMYSDSNRLLNDLRSELGDGRRRLGGLAFGFDIGQLIAEAVTRAPELTRLGIREGLERVKLVPAASGHDGTTLGFGRWEREALKGDYLVMRRWEDGTSVELPVPNRDGLER